MITWRVVSSPPIRMSSDSWMSESSSSWSPSTSACTSTLIRSSCGLGPARRDQPGGVVRVADEGVGGPGAGIGIAGERAHHGVAPLEQHLAVLGREAQLVADHDQRQRGGDVPHEVALAPLADAVDDLVADRADLVLALAHPAGREAPVHELAPRPVLRVVHVDHHRDRTALGPDAAGVRERLRDPSRRRARRRSATTPHTRPSQYTGALARTQVSSSSGLRPQNSPLTKSMSSRTG